jgi:hypothetical protein
LRRYSSIPEEAIAKAEAFYPVIEPLQRAISSFQNKPDHRLNCYESLMIGTPAEIIDGLDLLASDFERTLTLRTLQEEHQG